MEYTEQDKINAVNELRELLSLGEGKCIGEESLSLISAYINDLEVSIANIERELMELGFKCNDINDYAIVKGK